MTAYQGAIMILMAVLGTMITRFTPFLLFPKGRETPAYIRYLGSVLPPAAIAMLVVYCYKSVDVLSGAHGLPELIASAVVVILHLWKRQMLLSIAGGTLIYMALVQMVF